MSFRRRLRRCLPCALLLLALAPAARGSQWSGHNGTIRLSFAPRPDWNPARAAPASRQHQFAPDSAATATARPALPADGGPVQLSLPPSTTPVPVATVEAGPAGAMVDVYAVLDGVDLIYRDGVQVRAMGGVELNLRVEGEPAAVIVEQEFPVRAFNVYQEPGRLQAGFNPELSLRDGGATLVHWRVYFPGAPRNVRFGLDAAGLRTCETTPGCPGTGTQAVWVGSAVAAQAGLVFGAGWAPACLNWEGTPDLAVRRGTVDWSETGLFTRE